MNRMGISPAASALLRLLVARSRAKRDRILLTSIVSVEWRSLTFNGERHLIGLRVTGPNSDEIVHRLCDGIEEADFHIPGMIVADIGVKDEVRRSVDGGSTLTIEALTISED